MTMLVLTTRIRTKTPDTLCKAAKSTTLIVFKDQCTSVATHQLFNGKAIICALKSILYARARFFVAYHLTLRHAVMGSNRSSPAALNR
jgi:hypothetical protein